MQAMTLVGTALLLAFAAQDKREESRPEAHLGASTRPPTKEEVKEYSPPEGVRVQGQIVESLDTGGPAEKAGIAKGDMILTLAGVKVFSRDAIEDVLRVTKPGTEVTALVKRAGTYRDEEVAVKLGERKAEARTIEWQYASLEQLDRALAQARKEGRKLLVGLSGAET
jgi:S1-C subfamily serine protease